MNFKFLIALGIFVATSFYADAQAIEGHITYNRKRDWLALMAKLPFLSQEEKDRAQMTWGKSENDGRNYSLFIKDEKSLYTYKEEESDGGYSWKQEKYVIIRDYNKQKINDQRELLGKKYRMEEDLPKRKWKILNEIKEIEGYLCMKAETTDTLKDQVIHAWFSDRLPVLGGPEGFGGLPGLILELDINDGEVLVTATNVDLETPIEKLPVPKKMKGKEITYAEFDQKVHKYIKETIEGHKNPYWRIRY